MRLLWARGICRICLLLVPRSSTRSSSVPPLGLRLKSRLGRMGLAPSRAPWDVVRCAPPKFLQDVYAAVPPPAVDPHDPVRTLPISCCAADPPSSPLGLMALDQWHSAAQQWVLSLRPQTTSTTYATYQRQFLLFCKKQGRVALPASPTTFIMFVKSLYDRGLARGTLISVARGAVADLHRAAVLRPQPWIRWSGLCSRVS